MTAKQFFTRLYREYTDDGVADCAAALSYYFLFSLFPFLFFLATLTAYLPSVQASIGTALESLRALLPAEAMRLIDTHTASLIAEPRPNLLTLGLLATLYTASRAVDALRVALNRAYDVAESRPLWKTELLAFGATIGGAVLLVVGIAALVAGGDLGLWAARHLGLADQVVVLWRWLRWPVIAAVVMLAASLAYHLLPDGKQRFKLLTPGAVFGTLAWLGATWGFDQYASNFASYDVTYGALGGVIILLTWFYITGLVFVMGGEINAIAENPADDRGRLGTDVA